MITSLHLENFKNFKNADLQLGPFSILVGKNATGKSNIRDAFRFLHGIGRGYALAEIFGEKYEDGVRVWSGIRGGINNIAYLQKQAFTLEVTFDIAPYNIDKSGITYNVASYHITIATQTPVPVVIEEKLCYGTDFTDLKNLVFKAAYINNQFIVEASINKTGVYNQYDEYFNAKPVLLQFADRWSGEQFYQFFGKELLDVVIDTLKSIRFFDLSPDALRIPSFPGQIVLGDRGENLSSVLQDICKDKERKEGIVFWLKELTPLDVIDLEFVSDPQGKIIVSLVEEDGRKTLAYSASDGTLRFLGLIAALFSSNPNQIYFLEELENGIHPTRQYLLLDLIQRRTSQQNFQVVATTHSSQILNFVEGQTLENASYLYRSKGTPDGHIKRIKDFNHIQDVLEDQSLGRLFEAGWLENMVAFDEDSEGESTNIENEKVAVAR